MVKGKEIGLYYSGFPQVKFPECSEDPAGFCIAAHPGYAFKQCDLGPGGKGLGIYGMA
ncbi:hypothetical protein ES705_48949 [subsurface metagenome]